MDEYTEQAIELVKRVGWIGISMLQRQLRIGYPRAARIMDELIDAGIVESERDANGKHRLINDPLATCDGKHSNHLFVHPMNHAIQLDRCWRCGCKR